MNFNIKIHPLTTLELPADTVLHDEGAINLIGLHEVRDFINGHVHERIQGVVTEPYFFNSAVIVKAVKSLNRFSDENNLNNRMPAKYLLVRMEYSLREKN